MDLITSSIIIAIIYLVVFILVDQYYTYMRGCHVGEVHMDEQYTVQFTSVFIVTLILGLTELDAMLCAAH